MAAAEIMPAAVMPTPWQGQDELPSPSSLTFQPSEPVKFDAKHHLAFERPEKVVMMRDIGYSDDMGVSPVAVSQPFKLFSNEAIQVMRDEVLNDAVMRDHMFKSNISACQLRGYSVKKAPFIHDAWHDPALLSIVSEVAGVDLVPVMDFEIGHVNVSVKSKQQADEELTSIKKERQLYDDDEGIAGCPWEDDKPIVGWHVDSYPFVCVLMLSDCTNMVGGETALRTANGDIMRVRGPEMGCAVVLQGRYITHQALRAFGSQERITMVTSFRPKSAMKRDDSVLTTVRGISDLNDLYFEFGEYRLEILEERIREELKKIRSKRRSGRGFDTDDFKSFLAEQAAFVCHTNKEIVRNEDVIPGFIQEAEL